MTAQQPGPDARAPRLRASCAAAEGRGSLVDAHTVRVELSSGGTRTLRTKHILLAVGGKPVKAPIPGAVRCLRLLHAPCRKLPFHTCPTLMHPRRNLRSYVISAHRQRCSTSSRARTQGHLSMLQQGMQLRLMT